MQPSTKENQSVVKVSCRCGLHVVDVLLGVTASHQLMFLNEGEMQDLKPYQPHRGLSAVLPVAILLHTPLLSGWNPCLHGGCTQLYGSYS